MSRLTVIALAVGLAMLLATPSEANCCCSNRLFGSGNSYVVTPGCEGNDCGPQLTSVTADFEGSFWILGDGNPTPGVGIDNGLFAAMPSNGAPGWMGSFPGYASYIWSTWCASAFIDGQPDAASSPNRCMAILFEDRSPETAQAVFALLVDAPDSLGNYEFETDGDFLLAPSPIPRIVASERISDTEVAVALKAPDVNDLAPSLYLDPICDDEPAIVGFQLYERRVPPGAYPADDLPANWTPLTEVIPLGEDPIVTLDCGGSSLDSFLATRLQFDSDYQSVYLSGPSTRIECDTNLADPSPQILRKPRNRERGGRLTRGAR